MNKNILKECVRLSKRQNNADKHPQFHNYIHWSFIVQDNMIVEIGKNKQGKPKYTNFGYIKTAKIHSEHDVYEKAKGLLKKNRPFEIVNIRLNKQGDLRLSKPCACCCKFLDFIGCKTVWFSTEVGFAKLRLS